MSKEFTAEQLIRVYDLKPHPEGGYYKENYRSAEAIPANCLPPRYDGNRPFSTAIYFLLQEGAISRLHRIASDEIWHFYLGGALTIVEFKDGTVKRTVLGPDVEHGEELQHVVRGGTWFGAFPNPQSKYSFVGCTVAPGFDFADFQMATSEELIANYPAERDLIAKLAGDR